MMKNLFFRLCLIFIVAFSAYSCRTDQFPEKETYSNSSKFKLTSQRIALSESKHKTQLLPQIESAKHGIESFSKKNMQGKGIFYGNGFSINTDEVIYIENGPNYHTYTFRIDRDNAPANAPVETFFLHHFRTAATNSFWYAII